MPDHQTERDPLYEKAVMIVRARNRASISLVQRDLLIGYNRASRLIEAMEVAGVVSECDENGIRTVLAAAPAVDAQAGGQVDAASVKPWQERCDWQSDQPATKLMVDAMKSEIADLRAQLAQKGKP